MEGELHKRKDGALYNKCSILLELSASDDVVAFKKEIEEKGFDVDEPSFWYGRRIGSKKMGFEERTPIMIAAMFGSVEVLKYVIGTGKVDVNRACGSDGITALHCAVAGGADSSVEAVKLLLSASADVNCADAYGNKPIDLIPIAVKVKTPLCSRRKATEILLKGEEESEKISVSQLSKKEYPIDASLPDINNGIYGTDDFRMFTFKIKPCSRAYSHDWTECPFVHPGENARRRDPRKYPYSCVPCPEFRKGACPKGDACEYAHGVFESWLHPAQYRTRLCKDEIGCGRKVCFFAHKPEDLRPVYASTGSAMPSSPSSVSVSSVDMATSTPPMSPMAAAAASPKSGNSWQNKVNLTPPALQFPGSRLKTAYSARDLDMEMELLGLENRNSNLQQQQQQLLDEISVLSQLQELSLKQSPPQPTQLQSQSPTGFQMRQNMNQLRVNSSSSPVRKQPSSAYGFDSSAAMAAAVMSARSSGFSNRSQSFIDRGAGLTMRSSNLSDWGSPDGKLDWGVQGDELNKLKKSASFGFRSNNLTTTPTTTTRRSFIPPSSNVHSGQGLFGGEKQQYNPWMEQLYIEQEQMVA